MLAHRLLLVTLLLSSSIVLSAQEDCSNGIDDDGDGLIDLNDTTDCGCGLAPSVPSLLPNPSLEEFAADQEGCESIQPGGLPDATNQANCLVGWQRASLGTTDSWNAFTLSGAPPFFPTELPQPLPSGTGVAGFWVGVRDSEDTEFFNRDGTSTTQYREYLAACLEGDEAILAGNDYRLKFSLGFMLPSSFENDIGDQVDLASPSPIELAIYGIRECSQLYFGDFYNCPEGADAEGYELIQTVTIRGTAGAWTPVDIRFTAANEYAAFAIGGSCGADPDQPDSEFYRNYYFIDDVILNRPEVFEQPVAGPVSVEGQTICADQITLTGQAANGAAYQWYKDGVALVGQTTNVLNLTPSQTIDGAYVMRVTTAAGCAITEEVVIQRPIIADVVPDSVALCPGLDTLYLQPRQPNGATFSWSDGSNQPYFLVTEPGNYSVTVSTVCEQQIEEFVAVETDNITARINIEPAVYCVGDTVTFSVTSDYYIQGSIVSPPSGEVIFLEPDQRYDLAVGQDDTILFDIIHPCGSLLETAVLTPDADFEVDATITDLSCENPVGGIDLAVDDSDQVEFSWSDPLGNPVGESSPRLDVSIPGTYRVELVDGVRCPAAYSYDVVYADSFRVNLTLDSLSCGLDGIATVSPAGGSSPYVVDWYRGTASAPFATDTNRVESLGVGDYRVTATDTTGCERTEVFTLTEPDSLLISAASSFADCGILESGIVTVTAQGGVPPYSYQLDNGSPVASGLFTDLEPGTYTVAVQDSRGCDPVTTEVEIIPPIPFTLDLADEQVINLGDSTLLELQVIGLPTESGVAVWTPTDSLSYPFGEGSVRVVASPARSTRYQVTYTSAQGCSQTDDILVVVDEAVRLYVPSAFSPNGDTNNDEFRVYPGPSVRRIVSFRVHDRWGGMVYEWSGEEGGWDGRLDGEFLNPGVYFYLVDVELINGRSFRTAGSVNLIR
ncbi:gliding motility-associated C-terminal domain-containing protein [Lewinella sp. IMCC34191]|uniref:T9SS type B sorting domain-containing protein n=1 Tax=Lewinella sp. IMCC34191 TaxID=2259172 RepID=UPI000E24AAA3|nr:gliding motility-associated C-terminal domain-containing protein [Lewinella sp. IMCC34191]